MNDKIYIKKQLIELENKLFILAKNKTINSYSDNIIYVVENVDEEAVINWAKQITNPDKVNEYYRQMTGGKSLWDEVSFALTPEEYVLFKKNLNLKSDPTVNPVKTVIAAPTGTQTKTTVFLDPYFQNIVESFSPGSTMGTTLKSIKYFSKQYNKDIFFDIYHINLRVISRESLLKFMRYSHKAFMENNWGYMTSEIMPKVGAYYKMLEEEVKEISNKKFERYDDLMFHQKEAIFEGFYKRDIVYAMEQGLGKTATGIDLKISCQSRHLWICRKLSAPINQMKRVRGNLFVKRRKVSAVYWVPSSVSSVVTIRRGWRAICRALCARKEMSAISVLDFKGFCGLTSHHI